MIFDLMCTSAIWKSGKLIPVFEMRELGLREAQK